MKHIFDLFYVDATEITVGAKQNIYDCYFFLPLSDGWATLPTELVSIIANYTDTHHGSTVVNVPVLFITGCPTHRDITNIKQL